MAAELHLHLEGSAAAEELGLEPFAFTDFAGFIQCFKNVVLCLNQPADYAHVTRALLRRLAQEGIDYAEITLSAGVVLWKKQDLRAVVDTVLAASSGHNVLWNLDAVRQFGADAAMPVAEIAAEYVGRGVVSFGIGGDEVAAPAPAFREAYAFARSKGLRLTAHAGETDGPASVWAALEIGAERIGHGVRSIDDPVLVRHLSDHHIPLEVCPTSNIRTGAIKSWREHPALALHRAGVPITLNTDDPAIFGTTLAQEFALARDVLGFTSGELAAVAENAYRYRFT
jgi:aminodeoxyfutalosine deaminase